MPGPALALAGGSLASGALSASAAKKAAKAQAAAADQATQLQREQFEQTTANYKPFLDAGKDAMAAYLYEMGLGPKPMIGVGAAPAIETIAGATTVTPGVGPNGEQHSAYNTTTTGPDTYRVNGQDFMTLGEAEAFAESSRAGGTAYGGYSASPMAKYLMEEGSDSIRGLAASSGGLYSGAALEALEGNRKQIVEADTSDYFSKLFGLTNMGMSAAGNQASAGQAYAGNVGNLAMQAAQAKGQGYMGAANAWGSTIGDMAGIYGYFGGQQSNPMAAYAAPTMRPQANPYY